MEEESFPRGGQKSRRIEKRTIDAEPEDSEPNLFKDKSKDTRKNKRSTISSKKLKERKGHVKAKKTVADIVPLSVRILTKGTVVLGCVRKVKELEVEFFLPNNVSGCLPITEISDDYKDHLKALSTGNTSNIDVALLNDLFKEGDVVPCCIVETPKLEESKKVLKLSINPKLVNQTLSAKQLHHGMLLHGTVSSVEDHGYIIDVGMKGMKGFLRNKEAEKFIQLYNEGYPLKVGKAVWCSILMDGDRMNILTGETRTVNLTLSPDSVRASRVTSAMGLSLDSLLPGMKMNVAVEKVLTTGILVKINKFRGAVHMSHLPKSPKQYSAGEKVDVVLLFKNSTTKQMTFSGLAHLVDYNGAPVSNKLGKYKVGDIVETAVVKKCLAMEKNRMIYFDLGVPVSAIAKSKHISDETLKMEEFLEKFKKGSSHKCRIMHYSLMDNEASVNTKESILKLTVFSIHHVKPGDIIKCNVNSIGDKCIHVDVTPRIKGVISNLHSADVPLLHPEKKFHDKEELKCRVLSVDLKRNKVHLTHKKSLVTTKLPILSSFDQLKPGLVVEGFIGGIKDNGVTVYFYDNMKGWVSQKDLSTEEIQLPTKIFYLGQVVKCQVLGWSAEEEKLYLSFKIGLAKGFGHKEVERPPDYQIGKEVQGVVKEVTEGGLNVTLAASQKEAFLPASHLSDTMENWKVLLQSFQKGMNLSAIYYNHINAITLSRRESFKEYASEQSVITDTEHLQPGMMIPGTVKNIMSYGIFVELIGGLVGLVPTKYTTDKRITDLKQLFTPKQPVVAKVIEVDGDKKRFLASLRMTECYHGNTEIGLSLLRNYLSDIEEVYAHKSAEAGKVKGGKKRTRQAAKGAVYNYRVGQITEVTVTDVTSQGALCKTNDDVKGLCIKDFLPEAGLKKNQKVSAVVLFVDLEEGCLEVGFRDDLVKSLKKKKESLSDGYLGKCMKCETLVVKPYCVIGFLQSFGSGNLVYIPAKQHLNDVLEPFQFTVGQTNPVVIKEFYKGFVLCSLQIHEIAMEKKSSKSVTNEKDLGVGTVCYAKIKKILNTQMNVQVGGKHGRVHITQVKNQVTNGESVFDSFKGKDEVKVTVIGHRSVTDKENPKKKVVIPECSMKTKATAEEANFMGYKKYKVGDKVPAYVLHYKKNLLWCMVDIKTSGRVHRLNLTKNKQMLANPQKHFLPGKAYNATVISVDKTGTLELSFLDVNRIEIGSNITGEITHIKHRKGLELQLPYGYKGTVGLTDICDKFVDRPLQSFKRHQTIKTVVLSVNHAKRMCSLSCRPSRLEPQGSDKVVDPEVSNRGDLSEGKILRGFVVDNEKKSLSVCLGTDLIGKADSHHIFDQEEDQKNIGATFLIGKVVKVKVISLKNKDIVSISIKPSDIGEKGKKKTEKEKTENDENLPPKHGKRKKTEDISDASPVKSQKNETRKRKTSSSQEEAEGSTSKKEKISLFDVNVPKLEVPEGFSWNVDLSSLTAPTADDSDSDTDNEEDSNKKLAKKTKAEIMDEKKQQEKQLFELEQARLKGESSLQSVDDFDRLVVASPDNSLVWLQYMAFLLEMAEIDKARAVAERALKTISFREDQEKLNVWIAYLKLENMYGTQESVKTVLDRAVQQCDAMKVYQQLINIYMKAGKMEETESLYNTILKKFKQDKDVWIGFGLFYYKNRRAESARKLLDRSFQSLEKRHHVDVIAKFGQMEFRHGEIERGKSMFESILANYPKRTDLWSVYIDMVIKTGDMDAARKLFERVINIKISAKKMKFFFKKYLEFEKAHGNEENVNAVKDRALKYVESQGYVDE